MTEIYETPHKIDEGHATSDEGSTNTFVPGNYPDIVIMWGLFCALKKKTHFLFIGTIMFSLQVFVLQKSVSKK